MFEKFLVKSAPIVARLENKAVLSVAEMQLMQAYKSCNTAMKDADLRGVVEKKYGEFIRRFVAGA